MVLIPHSMTMSSLYVILKLPVKILDQTKLSTTIKRKIQFAAAEAELFSSRNSLRHQLKMTELSGKNWDLSLYELHRTPQEAITDNKQITISPKVRQINNLTESLQ